VRTAWEERLDRNTSRLQTELSQMATAGPAVSAAQPTPGPGALAAAAREAAALQADAIDLGAMGTAELDAIGQQAAAELDRLGARGASALASTMVGTRNGEGAAVAAAPASAASRAAPRELDASANEDNAIPAPRPPPSPMAPSSIPRASPPYAQRKRHPSAAAKPAAAARTKAVGGLGGVGNRASSTPQKSTVADAKKGSGTVSGGEVARASSSPAGEPGGGGAHTEETSFQPRINQRSARLAAARDGTCYSRLSSQRAEAYAKREIQRMEHERDQLAECTFTPKINRPQSAGVKQRGGGASSGAGGGTSGAKGGENHCRRVSAGERLHQEADRRAEMRERTRVASEMWERSSHRFAPHINPTSSMIAAEGGIAPLHERVEEMQRRKEENLHMIRLKVEEEQQATFAPQINPASAAIATASQQLSRAAMPPECGGLGGLGAASSTSFAGGGGVVERLSAEAAMSLERRAQREQQRREAEQRQCTFKPQVNELSERIVSDAEIAGDKPGSVFARLEQAGRAAEERRQAREAQALEMESALFQPCVSEANDILLTARNARLNETPLERSERLTYVDPKRKEAIVAQLQAAHFSQYTHRPTIDSISARLARSKTDAELSANPRGKALKEQLARQQAEQESEECTFKPKLDSKSQAIAANTGSRSALAPESIDTLSERLALEQKERADRLERARAEAEAQALRECTFAPQVQSRGGEHPESTDRASKEATEKPLVIKGLGRYMELKQMAKRQQEAQKQREQKAFLIEPPARLYPYTVPEPFKLHPKGVDERIEKARVEVERQRMEECTFSPRTNEASITTLLKAKTTPGYAHS
jgi:hypothetical protein